MTSGVGDEGPPRRSSGALDCRRVPLSWPEDQPFRILSIDGGGIRGVYPATFLAGLEQRYLGGESVARYFDLIAGTSTGGILAVGLGAGITAVELRDLYVGRGCEIFPPIRPRALERVGRGGQECLPILQVQIRPKGVEEDSAGDARRSKVRRGGDTPLYPVLRRSPWRGLHLQDTPSSRFSPRCARVHDEGS